MADMNEPRTYEMIISEQTLSHMKSSISSGIFLIAIILPRLEVFHTGTEKFHTPEVVLTAITVILAEAYCFTWVIAIAGEHLSMADLLNCGSTLLAVIVAVLVYLKHVAHVPGLDCPELIILLAAGMFVLACVEKVLRDSRVIRLRISL